MYKTNRENIPQYLQTPISDEIMTNRTFFTRKDKYEIEDIETVDSESIDEIVMVQEEDEEFVDENEEKMKYEWDTLVNKHENRKREKKEPMQVTATKILENTQFEMQNIYNSMIQNLKERQIQKENNLLFLEKLACGCDKNAESCKHQHAECFEKKKQEMSKESLPLFKLRDYPKFSTSDILKENTAAESSTDLIIISDNVSLSTITEKISGTPSELISTSKESEPSNAQSKEELQDYDLNRTYCINLGTIIDIEKDNEHVELKRCYNESCKIKQSKSKKERKNENTICNLNYSARLTDASPKSNKSEKSQRKSAGFFEPFMFCQTFGSTKTSFHTSDNESGTDNMKTVMSTTGSTVSFIVQEDLSPKEEILQSTSMPITSRITLPVNEETQQIYINSQSTPCTPKKLRWQDKQSNLKSIINLADRSAKNSSRKIFHKNSDYDEGNETASIPLIKNFHPEVYKMKTNEENIENEFEMQMKIVPPLPLENITPEHSESEDSRPISCSSHFSERTLRTIDNYNLECSSSLKHNTESICLKDVKKQSKNSPLRMKPQSASTRAYSIVDKSIVRKHNMEPINRERHISAPTSSSHKRKESSPKIMKVKSTRIHHEKNTQLIKSYRNLKKKKSSPKSPSAKKSKIKSEAASPDKDTVCHCEFYKKSKNNYCKIHGTGIHSKINSVPVTQRSDYSKAGSSLDWTTRSQTRKKTSQEDANKMVRSRETSPKKKL